MHTTLCAHGPENLSYCLFLQHAENPRTWTPHEHEHSASTDRNLVMLQKRGQYGPSTTIGQGRKVEMMVTGKGRSGGTARTETELGARCEGSLVNTIALSGPS